MSTTETTQTNLTVDPESVSAEIPEVITPTVFRTRADAYENLIAPSLGPNLDGVSIDDLPYTAIDYDIGDDGQWGYTRSVTFDLDALIVQTNAPVLAEVYAAKIADMAQALSTLRAQMSELSGRSATAETELEEFKNRVAAVASRYAKAHGWCSVVDEALSDLGLERISSRYTGVLTIRVEFTATCNDPGRGIPTESWVQSSLTCEDDITRAIRRNFSMDSESSDWSVNDISFDIDDVEEAEDD